ncbi:polysaccharide deacetylase [Siminovitchia acidinfaciens]|uniref:Polysaccharide deacetylase n=2 Tax=Siminovitchia acidinfaciens TaxID=2321395 RepID=A0A429XW16_9BACI|nr:polysaccharide deacetylase [Siminovitchia acidinfaciens]
MEMTIEKPQFHIQDQVIPFFNKPGIAFSFDDSFRVNDWFMYGKDIFGYYDVKVTFNINAFHHFEGQREHTQEEIDLLLELQSNGHEIAHHGFKHQDGKNYSRKKGLSGWIDDEIISLLNWMEKQVHSKTNEKFRKPVSFAFPYSEYTEGNIQELVPKYFKIVRGHLFDDNLTRFNHTGFAPSICIDSILLPDIKHIKKIMKIAKIMGSNLIIMCHSILPEEVNWADFGWGEDSIESGQWRVSPKTIREIINEARRIDMEFYTTSEIAGVASFIDRNMESWVRKQISNPDDQWISIRELSLIKELDLSNKNISNLDGIQYFTNLEKLNISNNHISDFRLLEKLPKLKNIEISNNPILNKKLLVAKDLEE